MGHWKYLFGNVWDACEACGLRTIGGKRGAWAYDVATAARAFGNALLAQDTDETEHRDAETPDHASRGYLGGRMGCNRDTDGDSCTYWAVFERARAERFLAARGVSIAADPEAAAAELADMAACWRGEGLWHDHTPTVRVTRTRVVCLQFCERDL